MYKVFNLDRFVGHLSKKQIEALCINKCLTPSFKYGIICILKISEKKIKVYTKNADTYLNKSRSTQ